MRRVTISPFLHTNSKGGDDDSGALVFKWCIFATKAQRFDFRRVVKKPQTEQATCIIFDCCGPQMNGRLGALMAQIDQYGFNCGA